MEDAEFAMIGLGTWVGAAREAVDQLRAEGRRAGLVKLRFVRPFPARELREALKGMKAVGVFERSASFNGFGPLFTELRSALYGVDVPMTDHFGGIGGRDITVSNVREMYEAVERHAGGDAVKECTWHGLRGEQG